MDPNKRIFMSRLIVAQVSEGRSTELYEVFATEQRGDQVEPEIIVQDKNSDAVLFTGALQDWRSLNAAVERIATEHIELYSPLGQPTGKKEE